MRTRPLKDQGFSMVSINTVETQNERIPEWREKNKFTFPILVGAQPDWLRQNYEYQVSPTNLLVNSEDKVLFRHLGYGPGREKIIEAEIREMLGLDPFEVLEAATGKEE